MVYGEHHTAFADETQAPLVSNGTFAARCGAGASDRHTLEVGPTISPVKARLLAVNDAIRLDEARSPDFLHSALCHVGFPRRRLVERVFERRSGNTSILIEAGRLYDGAEWIEHPLPYGAIPRLLMVYASSEAVRKGSPVVELGDSVRQFLLRLGLAPSGGARGGYRALHGQIEALAACRVSIGMGGGERAVTVDAKPVHRFEAWSRRGEGGARIELSAELFVSLREHAVPLDSRALAALKHSSLALDVYTWLAHRLCRVHAPRGAMLSWGNLLEQFGQEYACTKNFKREFCGALRQVLVAYPDARVTEIAGGIRLHPSRPPIPTMP